MAHASTREKAKLQMKKIRKQKANKRAKDAQLEISYEEKQRIASRRFERTLKEEVDVVLYDYEHRQFPSMRWPYLREIFSKRILELQEEIKNKPDLSDEYSIEEKFVYLEHRKKKLNEQIDKLQGVLNDINR